MYFEKFLTKTKRLSARLEGNSPEGFSLFQKQIYIDVKNMYIEYNVRIYGYEFAVVFEDMHSRKFPTYDMN